MQTVPMGMADARRFRAASARNAAQGARAAVENTAVDQGIVADPLGVESEPPEPAPSCVRSISNFRQLCAKTAVFARGRQRHDLSRQRSATRGRKLRQRGLDLPGLYAAPTLW